MKRNRAGAQFSWAEPLRGPHRRYRRLANAANRLGALALAAVVIVAVAQARNGIKWPVAAMLVVLAGFGVGGGGNGLQFYCAGEACCGGY